MERAVGCTVPFFDLDPVVLRQFATGELDPVPKRLGGRWPCPTLTQIFSLGDEVAELQKTTLDESDAAL